MNSKFLFQDRLRLVALLGGLTLLSAGCDRDGVKVYSVAANPATPPGTLTPPAAADPGGAPQIKWTLPPGWQEKPAGQMRIASFSAPGTNGQLVDVSVVPLPGMAGGDLNNVNRWRRQVGQGPVQEADLARLGEPVTVGDLPALLFDQAGTPAATDAMGGMPAGGGGMPPVAATGKTRILAVGLHQPDMMWFFKATGDDESVALQKANFISLLRSIQFVAADATAALPAGHPDVNSLPAGHPDMGAMPAGHPDMGTMPPAGAAAAMDAGTPAPALPTWTVPTAWQTEPPTAMLLAKFSATENGAKAEITVSSFPGEVGGLLANVNRWRRQIGLSALADPGLTPAVTALTTPAGPASLVDFTGADPKTTQPARLVGVVIPLNGQSWFYKLMGNATVVEHQKADFLNFVQSAKY
jgi:hypothetical protein